MRTSERFGGAGDLTTLRKSCQIWRGGKFLASGIFAIAKWMGLCIVIQRGHGSTGLTMTAFCIVIQRGHGSTGLTMTERVKKVSEGFSGAETR